MKEKRLNIVLRPWDWRYSASIVGIYKYLIFFKKKEGTDFIVTEDDIRICSSDFTQEKYLQFVENYYAEEFQHLRLEEILNKYDITEEEQKIVNEILDHGDATFKKIFKKERFNGRNKAKILSLIRRNRNQIIQETFLTKKNMYGNYANVNMLFKETQSRCRVKGYYVDPTRKSKADSYCFNAKTFVSKDSKIFDFIPFAFHGIDKTFFINNSFSVKELININMKIEKAIKNNKDRMENTMSTSQLIFQDIKMHPDLIDYDVEVILKDKEKSYFQTIFIRQKSFFILKKINHCDLICSFLKVNDHYYLDMQEEVMKCIINMIRTDYLIELCFKRKQKKELISALISINVYLCDKDEQFKNLLRETWECAEKASEKLLSESIKEYKKQLITFISYKDYDKCCQILLYLSNHTEIIFDFIYILMEDFEENKDIAYTFINAFNRKIGNYRRYEYEKSTDIDCGSKYDIKLFGDDGKYN